MGRPKKTETSDEKCANCEKELTAYVVAGELKFCCDACAGEYFAKE